MLKVFEAFSGIGAQAKALERCKKQYGLEYEIIHTAEWDVNAIIAYDLIHNGEQDLSKYNDMGKEELVEKLSSYCLSPDGKDPYKEGGLKRNNIEMLKRLLCAIERTKNLVSVTEIKGADLPGNIDVLTYSFPCQNLSIASVIHGEGYMTGIDRTIKNRSGMLWEIERILKEMDDANITLPKFLLMENVTTLFSARHIADFESWQQFLIDKGYYNITYRKLNGINFNSPQARERSFMISVYVGTNKELAEQLDSIINLEHRLDLHDLYIEEMNLPRVDVSELFRDDYTNELYRREAEASLLQDTPSRDRIIEENVVIRHVKGETESCWENVRTNEPISNIRTITTKQDRNPTTAVIEYPFQVEGKKKYRYMTPRECFMGMGFDEEDFDAIVNNNFMDSKKGMFFTRSKLERMAGNSIVVNILQAIFKQISDIKDEMSKLIVE